MRIGFSRTLGSAAVVGLLASGAVLFGAAPAQASTITIPYLCVTNALSSQLDQSFSNFSVTITAPENVDIGDPIPATYSFGSLPTGLPFPVTNATVNSAFSVTGRVETTGTPTVTSTTGAVLPGTLIGTVPAYGTVAVPPTVVTIPTTGFIAGNRIELVPGEVRLNFVNSTEFGPDGAYVSCTPDEPVAFAARTGLGNVIPVAPDDRCVAYNSNQTGGPGCDTVQVVALGITAGQLTQRAYLNGTATTGSSDGSAILTPVAGTSNVNSAATQINLGTIESPLAPSAIVGNLNDITVTDSRGGTFGWSLTASLTTFTGGGSNTIANAALSASPACTPATNATAWDYTAPGQTAIAGFDDTASALGVTAGAAAQNFGGAVALCVKNTVRNLTTNTTGGVYTVSSPLTLTVPAFQAADKYTATMTITLA